MGGRPTEQRGEIELCLNGWVQSGGLPVGDHTRAASNRKILAALDQLVNSLRAGTMEALLTAALSAPGSEPGTL